MNRRTTPPITQATRHTAIIGDPVGLWSKLAWDVDVFRDIQVGYPTEVEPLSYAAINVCIAAGSLRNWVENVEARAARARGTAFDREGFLSAMHRAVPEQAACEAIANTAKHARVADGEWPGGEVRLEWREGDEDVPPGYVLLHSDESGCVGVAVGRFDALCGNWWSHLVASGLAAGQRRIPDWQQRKLHRIFGRRYEPICGSSETSGQGAAK